MRTFMIVAVKGFILSAARLAAGLSALSFYATLLPARLAAQPQPFDVPPGAERICMSLRALQEEAGKALALGHPFPAQLTNLGGLSYPEGIILDRANDDLLLVGLRIPERPALRLDDLMLAVTSVGEGWPAPFCSLDPKPENIQKLNARLSRLTPGNSPTAMERQLQALREAVGPQTVRVGGVPQDSRQAHVMINADYRLKQITLGQRPVPGIKSLLDLRAEALQKQSEPEGNNPPGSGGLVRVWFHVAPGSPAFLESEGILWLDRCSIAVLTEAQMLTATGQLQDSAQQDSIAKTFVERFTDEFAAGLTRSIPVFAELENLYRLRAVLLAATHRRFDAQGAPNFSGYANGYRFHDARPMLPALPGLANGRQWTERIAGREGIYLRQCFVAVYGGADMAMTVGDENFTLAVAVLSRMTHHVLSARPSGIAVVWLVRSVG